MKDKINDQVLCVLKKKNSKVELDYEPIENKLPSELTELYNLCDSDEDHIKIINLIGSNVNLQKILGAYNYCESLTAAYEGWNNINHTIHKHFEIKTEFATPEERDEFIKNKKEGLKQKFKARELAYNIDLAYKKAASDTSIIAYSHREVGWITKHKLSNDFQIEFKTNFGYGRASYFYTRLKFKEIDIIPLSEWVTYTNTQYDTLILYSRKHNVSHNSWYDAIKYVSEAYNLSVDNEESFISKYLITECETMAKGLESMLESLNLEFKEVKGSHPHGPFVGHQQVEAKGERISGALQFIQSIITYDKVMQVKEFVDRIEKCNSNIQPVLVKSMALISQESIPLNAEFAIVQPEYNELRKVSDEYNEKRKELRTVMNQEEGFSELKFEAEFLIQFSDFKSFKEKYSDYSQKIYHPLKGKIDTLSSRLEKIKKYNTVIDKYFHNKNVSS